MSLPDKIDSLLLAATEAGVLPGVVAMVTNCDRTLYEGAFGLCELGATRPIAKDSVVLLASMSKPITATAAMQLVEQGKVDLEAPVSKWLPELESPRVLEGFDSQGHPKTRPARRPITLRHLLTHTAGFSYEFFSSDLSRFKEVTGTPGFSSSSLASLQNPLLFDPGERWEYGVNLDWVGVLVQRVSGKNLSEYLADHVFAPIGMVDTAITIRPDMRERLVTVHARLEDESLVPLQFELPQQPETEMGGQALYGTARDYLKFLQMILNRGESSGGRVLRAETVDAMARNQIGDVKVTPLKSVDRNISNNFPLAPAIPYRWSLAFMVNEKSLAIGRQAGSLSWSGLCNSFFWIDPVTGVAGVFLTQILPFADLKAMQVYFDFEGLVYR